MEMRMQCSDAVHGSRQRKRSNQIYFTFGIKEVPSRKSVLPANMDEARQFVVWMLRDKKQEQEDTW
jgi:hypothetical protein